MGTDAAKQVADKAERAAARPVTPSQDESDGDDGILVPDTRMRARLRASLRAVPALF